MKIIPIIPESKLYSESFASLNEDSEALQNPFPKTDRVEIQLFTTLQCNLSCSYCVMNEGDVLNTQGKPQYSTAQLKRWTDHFLHNKRLAFTFFGGEPLLNRPWIEEVMNLYPQSQFQIQTNGTLLSKTDPSILTRLDHFLISVDGRSELTNQYRGQGVFESVIRNVKSIASYAKPLSLTARMTWLDPRIDLSDFDVLLDTFDHVHFQFAQDERGYSPEEMAQKKENLRILFQAFIQNPQHYSIVPFMGIARNKLRPDLTQEQCAHGSHCRVSQALVNVRPDGEIFGCPDMTYDPHMHHGSIVHMKAAPSPLIYHANMPCSTCSAFSWCRGNCMKNLWRAYVDQDLKYRQQVVEPVCELVCYLGSLFDSMDLSTWFSSLDLSTQNRILFHPSYEWTEVIP